MRNLKILLDIFTQPAGIPTHALMFTADEAVEMFHTKL